MTTSAPIRREYDIPIVEPFRPPVVPKRLPRPEPTRVVWPIFVPVRQPERVRA